MADVKNQKSRASKDIAQQYTQLCTKMGDLQFKLANNQKDFELCMKEAEALNLEFVSAVEAENKQASADVPPPEGATK